MSALLLPLLVLGALLLVLQRLWPAWGPGEPVAGPSCAHCGGVRWRQRRCVACGLDVASPVAGELADLAATERQLDRFLHRSRIPDAAYRQLQGAIAAERARLLQSIPAAAPPRTETAGPAEDYPIAVSRRPGRARRILVRTAAAAVGLTIALSVITALEPGFAFGAGLLAFALFGWLAIRSDRAALHLVGLPSLVLGLLALIHQERGVAALAAPRSGWGLLFACWATAALTAALYRKQRARHARMYAGACLTIGAAGVASVALPAAGFQGPARAALIAVGCALAGMGLNLRWRRASLNALCCAVLACATLWAGWWLLPQQPAAWGTLLATLAIVLAAAAKRGDRSLSTSFVASAYAAAIVALSATGAAAWSIPGGAVAYVATAILLTLCFVTLGAAVPGTLRIRVACARAVQAVRIYPERSLFAAGLAVAFIVAVMQTVSAAASGVVGAALLAQALQCATIAGAAWSLAWLQVGGKFTDGAPWFRRHIKLVVGGNALLFGTALVLLLLGPPRGSLPWVHQIGTGLGALTLASLVAALTLAHLRGQFAFTELAYGGLGASALTLLAAVVYRSDPNLATRTGSAGAAVLTLGWALRQRQHGSRDDARQRIASRWLTAFGTLAVLFTIRLSLLGQPPAVAAVSVMILVGAALVASAGLSNAAWTFVAGVGCIATALLATWQTHVSQPFAQWWVQLVQVGAVAAALFSLAWQRVEGRTKTESSLPGLLSLLGLGAMCCLLFVPVAYLAEPGHSLPASIWPTGHALGWVALLIALAAPASRRPQWRYHLLGVFAAGLGVLVACDLAGAGAGSSTALVALLGVWTAAGAALFRAIRANPMPAEPSAAECAARGWTVAACSAVGLLALLAAVESRGDRAWATGFTAVVATLLAALGWRTRRLGHLAAAAILVNVIGSLLWSLGSDASPESFLFVQTFCLALTAVVGTILQRRPQVREPLASHLTLITRLAIDGAVALATGVAFTAFAASYLSPDVGTLARPAAIAWPAFIATAAALALRLRIRMSTSLAPLYALGWAALTVILRSLRLEPSDAAWALPLSAAGYCAASSFVASRLTDGAKANGHQPRWFNNAQLAAGATVLIASIGVALDGAGWFARLAGPASLALLALALRGLHPTVPVTVGTLALCEAGWSLAAPTGPVWLQRSALTVVALAVALVAFGRGQRRATSPAWRGVLNQAQPVVALLTAVLTVVTVWIGLAEHALAFDQHPQLWLIPPAALVLGVAFVQRGRLGRRQQELIGGLTCFAVYAASAAELFKTGPGQSVILPLVLGALAVAGLVGGVRGQLPGVAFQGAAFLAVAVLAVVYHFAVARGSGWLLWLVAAALAVGVAARKRLPTSRHLFQRVPK